MSSTLTNPALVTRDAARRLPRLALWLLGAAYVLPGVFGRDPWRNADLVAFGQMLAMAEGRTSWLVPALGGVPTEASLLPHWIGAASIALTSGWLEPALAARLPFAGLLALALAAIWYACFNLARTEAAQPLPLAFGGEAQPVDYARAVADGALLATIASLGLLQLGHETTPELAQLAALASFQWAVSVAPHRTWAARLGALLALPALAASDAPFIALALGLGTLVLCARTQLPALRRFLPWAVAATVLSVVVAWPVHAWRWRLGEPVDIWQLLRLLVWFLWPVWALACWTLWRWRGHLGHLHLAVPTLSLGIALVATIAMGGSDRALMLGLPGAAILAAFALPTLRRSTAAAIDWFSVFAFTLCALTVWLMYLAMQTGFPAKPAANLLKLAPGFKASFALGPMLLAALATVAWLALVRWRTGRHQAALWKSLVLPAGGVALCWLLVMTLWLPLLDYARSYRPVIDRLGAVLPQRGCIAAPGAAPALVAALEFHTKRRVDGRMASVHGDCAALLQVQRDQPPTGTPASVPIAMPWREVARVNRPTNRHEWLVVYRREAGAPGLKPPRQR
ncbi:MAG: hypothetical protein HY855_02340 [Burkholderiales bacterium]|nr:hypothetical protein [Burkholderiales bacterium]